MPAWPQNEVEVSLNLIEIFDDWIVVTRAMDPKHH